ncbi:MarR family winged helix-turn-helix transcriptional regulator [Sphingopyxis granuli]|uniref:MarR family regulator n=1 Tax=Sphingopyxis granuli TaxID=267128 RepID=A0AA86GLD2_9SPHN|nr:MarR family transcriptional regulator [Sphingopyxis granuli]AMG73458.1 MarR family regulator [Sphingopyxis granuli]
MTRHSEKYDQWDVELGVLMHDVARLRRVVFDKDMKPLGVTRSHAWVLARLGAEDGLSQVELAAVLSVGKAALGGILDGLEASDLISRSDDPVDRRVRRVYVTDKGRQAIRAMRQRLRPLSERILRNVKAEDRDNLLRSLQTVKSNLLELANEDPE